jgi:nucleoside-diphosphate-sugar epimerase
MNVFITGATGFIGFHLAKRLAEEGHMVHAIYRSIEKTRSLNHNNIKWFKGDILDVESLEIAIKDCVQVYHLAAYAVVWEQNLGDFAKYNIQGTINVIEVALKNGINNIVITSTAGVFGPSLKGEINENTLPTITYFTGYERTKAESEKIIEKYSKEGRRIILVNPTRVYGPGVLNESNSVTIMIKKYIEGKWHFVPGNGESIGNYAFIDDVVNGHILAMKNGKNCERYLLGGENISYNGLFNKINDIIGKKHRLIKTPLFLMLGMANFLIILNKFFRIRPMITPAHVRKFNYNWETNISKAERELGYTKTAFDDALKKTIYWINFSINN